MVVWQPGGYQGRLVPGVRSVALVLWLSCPVPASLQAGFPHGFVVVSGTFSQSRPGGDRPDAVTQRPKASFCGLSHQRLPWPVKHPVGMDLYLGLGLSFLPERGSGPGPELLCACHGRGVIPSRSDSGGRGRTQRRQPCGVMPQVGGEWGLELRGCSAFPCQASALPEPVQGREWRGEASGTSHFTLCRLVPEGGLGWGNLRPGTDGPQRPSFYSSSCTLGAVSEAKTGSAARSRMSLHWS